jgi:hypothetical protein
MVEFSELADKQRIMKEISPDFDVTFDVAFEEYCISHKDVLFRRVPVDGFTRQEVEEIRRVVWINENGNILEEVDNANEKRELDNEKKASDLYYQMAQDIRKPLIKEVYGI